MIGNLLVLPGSNPELREWTESVSREVGSLFDGSTIHEYLHWSDPSIPFDFHEEVGRLRSVSTGGVPLYVFAKSFGSVLALSAEKNGFLSPTQQIFAGVPLKECLRSGFPLETHFKDLKVPTLFFQNKRDPFGSSEELQMLLRANVAVPYELHTFDRDDHDYPDIASMRSAIEAFLAE